MPRREIEIDLPLEHLSILDEDGELDEELDPELDDEALLEIHRVMLLARRFDERLLQLQRQGDIGTFAPVKGQEAAQVGAVAALEDRDWMVPSFRETAAFLWRGAPLEGILLYNAGYTEGARIPEGENDLPIAVPVATQVPHAAGIAYAAKLKGADEVTLVFFGDGATSEGDFHEALNFAGVFDLPVVFVCQNNQWAISVPRERQTAAGTLAQKAVAYGVPGLQVDGNDVLAVYAGVAEAVERARDGGGPTLVECVTYRLSLHTTADDPTRYRDEEEVERWEARDPIPRLQGYLERRDLLDDEALERLEEEIEEEIQAAWDDAQAAMEELPGAEAIFEHVLAEPSPAMEAQRRTLAGGEEE